MIAYFYIRKTKFIYMCHLLTNMNAFSFTEMYYAAAAAAPQPGFWTKGPAVSHHTKTAFLCVCPVCEPPHVMPPDFLLYTLTHTYTSVIPSVHI